MKFRLCVLALTALSGLHTVCAADHVLLTATFDNETVGALVGTGGALAGEPVSLFCHGDSTPPDCATIGTSPFPTPNLQIRDTDTYYAQDATFEFLGAEEVTSGTVQIRAQVLFTGSGQPQIGLREQGSAALTFLQFYAGDNTPYLGAYTGNSFHGGLGQYVPNVIVPLEIDASADQKLISVYLNGIALLDSVAIDLSTTRGIGSILIGNGNTLDTPADVMRVDNLRAVACESTTFNDCLWVDGFDP